MPANRLHKVVIDANRNIVTRKRSFAARAKTALPCKKDISFDLSRKSSSNGIALLEERSLHTLERFFSNTAICATNIDQVIALCELNLFAFLIFNLREFQVGIINHRKNGVWNFRDLACGCQYSLHFRGTDMRTIAIYIVQLLSIKAQSGSLSHKSVKSCLGQGQDFWLDVGDNFRSMTIQLHIAINHPQISAVFGIVILAHRS